jgi:hypothetical protein
MPVSPLIVLAVAVGAAAMLVCITVLPVWIYETRTTNKKKEARQ